MICIAVQIIVQLNAVIKIELITSLSVEKNVKYLRCYCKIKSKKKSAFVLIGTDNHRIDWSKGFESSNTPLPLSPHAG